MMAVKTFIMLNIQLTNIPAFVHNNCILEQFLSLVGTLVGTIAR